MPRFAMYSCMYCAVYSLALSVVIRIRYLVINRAIASTALVRASGTLEQVDRNASMAYLVAGSTHVMKYLLRVVESGLMGPQTSDEMLCPFWVVCYLRLCGFA